VALERTSQAGSEQRKEASEARVRVIPRAQSRKKKRPADKGNNVVQKGGGHYKGRHVEEKDVRNLYGFESKEYEEKTVKP